MVEQGKFCFHFASFLLFHNYYRAVYDGKQHTEFMDKLEERIRVHDRDIERMCNYHYQGFIESVNELLKVRGEARKLKVCSYSVALSANSTETPFPTCVVVILSFIPVRVLSGVSFDL